MRGERRECCLLCSLCTNELSINENGKHLFCEHKRFSWINYCTTATKWKQKVQHRSSVAHFPLTNCYQSLANGTAQHGAGDGTRARRPLKLHVNCNFRGYILSVMPASPFSNMLNHQKSILSLRRKQLTEAWWQYFPALHHFASKTKNKRAALFCAFWAKSIVWQHHIEKGMEDEITCATCGAVGQSEQQQTREIRSSTDLCWMKVVSHFRGFFFKTSRQKCTASTCPALPSHHFCFVLFGFFLAM